MLKAHASIRPLFSANVCRMIVFLNKCKTKTILGHPVHFCMMGCSQWTASRRQHIKSKPIVAVLKALKISTWSVRSGSAWLRHTNTETPHTAVEATNTWTTWRHVTESLTLPWRLFCFVDFSRLSITVAATVVRRPSRVFSCANLHSFYVHRSPDHFQVSPHHIDQNPFRPQLIPATILPRVQPTYLPSHGAIIWFILT